MEKFVCAHCGGTNSVFVTILQGCPDKEGYELHMKPFETTTVYLNHERSQALVDLLDEAVIENKENKENKEKEAQCQPPTTI